ncbi:MAG: DNA polymerase/3'-5' exonuclease PolX [Hydrogenibacillus schlegelii]|uniref:DNA polymerase beta n=1 Tax=Hydrogenibacillus schlegelii TaxID=1484 RepID=A0A947D1C0_HYDSH|nr:DNA polymerase/3'-5' exonuclease PolX [Hydrogenibacillus schlegelii]
MDVTNRFVARILEKIADYSELLGENEFKVRSFRRAAQTIESLDAPVGELMDRGEAIPGVGKGIAAVIREVIETGESELLKALEAKVPKVLIRLLAVPGIGPKTVGRLLRELGIDSEVKLEAAIREQKIRALSGFGAKTERRIAEALRAARDPNPRHPLAEMWPIAREICRRIERLPGVERCEVAGSLRRVMETVKDVDLAVATRVPERVATAIRDAFGPERIEAAGPQKVVFIYDALWPIPVEVRFFRPEAFGAGLLYLTGSKAHNIALRQRAKAMELRLSEYGLETEGAEAAGDAGPFPEEADVYTRLGLPWIPPELRDTAEVFHPERLDRIESLIGPEDIQGDLHMHTRASDGGNTIEEMARAARARGYRYIAITDHSASLKVAGGLSPERLLQHVEAVREVEAKLQAEGGEPFYLLAGTEMDILADGSLDYPDAVLERLDFVIASVHTAFRLDRAAMTARILRAIEHPLVDLIAHPTGRMIGRREGYDVDLDAVIGAAVRHGKALELNASLYRLDLPAPALEQAARAGAWIAIDTDAHSVGELEQMSLGVRYARKAYVPRDRVLNALPPEALLAWLARRRGRPIRR